MYCVYRNRAGDVIFRQCSMRTAEIFVNLFRCRSGVIFWLCLYNTDAFQTKII